MQKEVGICLALILVAGISTNYAAYSQQQQPSLATFQETAQIVIDKSISQNVTASINLQSTSIQEIKIPAELEKRIREDDRITSVILTNQQQCVLGVINESCVIINVSIEKDDRGIFGLQDNAKEIADSYIGKVNQAFDTDAKFHSVFIHTDDRTNEILKTSGVISGKGTISAVYTLPMEDTYSMYEKISAILIPKTIRENGGFYGVAKELASEENSKMTFSIIPLDTKSLLQLKLSVDYPNKAPEITEINPLEFFKVDKIERTSYFDSGFYPLNSIIQIVILSPESVRVSDVNAKVIPTQIIDNEKIPTEITKAGWIFDPEEGKVIQGKYIFGEQTFVNKDDLKFSIRGDKDPQKIETGLDESVIVVVIITAVAVAATVFYLKGYKNN